MLIFYSTQTHIFSQFVLSPTMGSANLTIVRELIKLFEKKTQASESFSGRSKEIGIKCLVALNYFSCAIRRCIT